MIRYAACAAILKAFSATPGSRRLYRWLGNSMGARRRVREGLPLRYVGRAHDTVRLLDEFAVLSPGDRVLEVGTGWVHWESLIIRLFYDVSVDMTDVWDNRLFDAFQAYSRQFHRVLAGDSWPDVDRARRACDLLSGVSAAEGFDPVYDALHLRYVQDAAGDLAQFEDNSVQSIISADVLEHVHRDTLRPLLQNSYRLLRPGGYSLHLIDLEDHLSAYDRAASPKQYLAYSDRQWRTFYENRVQYINRLQRPEWLDLFGECGFQLLREERRTTDAAPARVSRRYQGLNGDLGCTELRLVHRKPA
ncbi:MAG: methyltransferase domain-containing protein [Anaerolineae bacterium]